MTALLANRRCVVLGGGGFIGTNLRIALSKLNARVIGYGRRPRFAVDAGEWIDGDFNDRESIANAVDGADYVFHLIGDADPRQSNLNPVFDARVHVPASLAVLEACRDAKVAKVVFLSSGGAIYRPGLALPIAEDAACDPISAYGIGKLTVEKYCGLFRRLYDLDTAILRIANPYGPYQSPYRGQGFIAKLIHRAIHRQPLEIWGDGSTVRDYLFIDDVVAAMIAAAARPMVSGPLNIGSGVGRSLREVVADVERVVNHPVDISFEVGRTADTPANILDIKLAAELLDWRPAHSWIDGLERTRNWLTTI